MLCSFVFSWATKKLQMGSVLGPALAQIGRIKLVWAVDSEVCYRVQMTKIEKQAYEQLEELGLA